MKSGGSNTAECFPALGCATGAVPTPTPPGSLTRQAELAFEPPLKAAIPGARSPVEEAPPREGEESQLPQLGLRREQEPAEVLQAWGALPGPPPEP